MTSKTDNQVHAHLLIKTEFMNFYLKIRYLEKDLENYVWYIF